MAKVSFLFPLMSRRFDHNNWRVGAAAASRQCAAAPAALVSNTSNKDQLFYWFTARCTHTHTHIHTHAHSLSRLHTFTPTHSFSLTHTRTYAHTLALALTETLTVPHTVPFKANKKCLHLSFLAGGSGCDGSRNLESRQVPTNLNSQLAIRGADE